MANEGIQRTSVVIANGATLSGAADLGYMQDLFGIVVPAAFTGTSLTFTVAPTAGGTYVALYGDDGNAITVTVAQGRTYTLRSVLREALRGWRYLKIVSSGAEGAERTVVLLSRAAAGLP